jgi:hypothetical protein
MLIWDEWTTLCKCTNTLTHYASWLPLCVLAGQRMEAVQCLWYIYAAPWPRTYCLTYRSIIWVHLASAFAKGWVSMLHELTVTKSSRIFMSRLSQKIIKSLTFSRFSIRTPEATFSDSRKPKKTSACKRNSRDQLLFLKSLSYNLFPCYTPARRGSTTVSSFTCCCGRRYRWEFEDVWGAIHGPCSADCSCCRLSIRWTRMN